ncbi:PrpF domain-containing protein [Nocardiopsis salina]|uniref:PrpF domain-containing protein n=1 Tax=Nocardiopsis salina TaxID=245836 RepID=UPI0003467131
MLSMGRTHPALAVTVSVAFSAASVTEGMVVPRPGDGGLLRIATPSGTITVRADLDRAGALETAYVTRNARRLATAELELPGEGRRAAPHPRRRQAPPRCGRAPVLSEPAFWGVCSCGRRGPEAGTATGRRARGLRTRRPRVVWRPRQDSNLRHPL